MDVRSHNRAVWNRNAEAQNRWTLPVAKEVIDRARAGEFDLLLTPTKPVPMLAIATVEGDMADLLAFSDGAFDLVVHPCSNCFVPDIRPVWRECFRVLRAGGILLAGFTNPVRYLFDDERMQNGSLEVRHSIPYSDLTDLSDADRRHPWDLARL